jgi:hypothetical protein
MVKCGFHMILLEICSQKKKEEDEASLGLNGYIRVRMSHLGSINVHRISSAIGF